MHRLPDELRARAARRLNAFLGAKSTSWPVRWSGTKRDEFIRQVQAVVNALQNEPGGDVEGFVRRTEGHDRFRGHSIKDYIPDLAPLFGQNPVRNG